MDDMPDLDSLLHDGATVTYLGEEYVVSRRDAGTLVLPSGQVVVKDPLTMRAEVIPLAVTAAPGRYPVVSWVLQTLSRPRAYDVAYCAALQLVVRDEPVVAWEPAVWCGDDPAAHANFYAVDRGIACFMDLVAARALGTWDEDKVDRVIVNRVLYDSADACIVVQLIDPETEANVVISDCGGDGGYGVWIGHTVDGDLACFVTDFVVADSQDGD
ncbi:DUF4241 domain-containing protein [Streptomyces sp. NPDC002659]|uniref:DUF4241 domain-containing protein n=1 Tax=Streptomyces sp. NPDC002659 TaxID=3364656 RepID=UPI00368A2884